MKGTNQDKGKAIDKKVGCLKIKMWDSAEIMVTQHMWMNVKTLSIQMEATVDIGDLNSAWKIVSKNQWDSTGCC